MLAKLFHLFAQELMAIDLQLKNKHRLSSLYTHLKVHADDTPLPDYNRPSLGDYILILIE